MTKQIMDERVIYNQKIINAIQKVLDTHPYLRFTQLLSILKLDEDRFYEEPKETYHKIMETIKSLYS
jgi:hypothetical protein